MPNVNLRLQARLRLTIMLQVLKRIELLSPPSVKIPEATFFQIGEHVIGPGHPVYVVAELSFNHQ